MHGPQLLEGSAQQGADMDLPENPQENGEDPPEPISRFSARGKLLLFGEHAAVYGHPALGVSLDSRLSISVSPAVEDCFPGLAQEDEKAARGLIAEGRALFPGLHIPPGRYEIESAIPRGSGFGSSAGVCTALSGYLHRLCRQQNIPMQQYLPDFLFSSSWPEDEQETYLLWFISNHLEKFFHGSPSGIDTGLAIREGIHAFFPRSRKLPDTLPLFSSGPGLWLIYGALTRDGDTKSLVGGIQEGMLSRRPKVVDAIEKLGELAHDAIELFTVTGQEGPAEHAAAEIPDGLDVDQQNGSHRFQLDGLAGLARRARPELQRLGLETPAMERILDQGIRLGSPGGKLSGAGGGGAFYLFAEDRTQAEELARELSLFARDRQISLVHPLTPLKI